MTLPAAVSIAAFTLGLAVAILSWRVTKAPGWREMRHFAVISATASVYCLGESVMTLNMPDVIVAWASRIGMVFAAFHGPSWMLYIAAQQHRRPKLWEKLLVATAVAAAVVSILPNVVVTDTVLHRPVPWLGVVYSDVQATSFGAFVYAIYCVTVVFPLATYLRAAIRREPGAAAHAIGLLILSLAAVNDALVGVGRSNMPYLLSAGFMAVVAITGSVLLGRFVDQAKALELLSRDLEKKVAARTNDLTETQEALVQAEKLAALGRLAAGAAHEINNPCSVVNTNLAYLRHALLERAHIPEDTARCLDESADATARVTRIVRNLVDAGRAAHGIQAKVRSFAIQPVVERAISNARVALDSQVRVEVVADAEMSAQGDPVLLQQVLVNLLTNATQAVEARKGASHVQVRAYLDGDHVLIDVKDDGVGIPPSDAARIFEPFFTTKRPGEGMGLGLSVSLGLARAQGGDITLASTGPEGTTMRVRIEQADRPSSPLRRRRRSADSFQSG